MNIVICKLLLSMYPFKLAWDHALPSLIFIITQSSRNVLWR